MNKLLKYVDYLENPFYLAGFALLIYICLLVFGGVFSAFSDNYYILFPWMVAAGMLLFYSIFCGIIMMTSPMILKNWGKAVYGFMGYAIVSGFIAFLVSGVSIFDASTYTIIYFVLSFSFIVFMAIGMAVKGVIQYTENKDKKKWEGKDQQ